MSILSIHVCFHGEKKNVDILFSGAMNKYLVLAFVAQLDACPSGDQEVAGSTPAEVGNILTWRLIMKYFLRSFSSFR